MDTIDRIDVYRVEIPLLAPFQTAFAKTYSFESVLVRFQAGPFISWAEAAPWRYPAYCAESTSGVMLNLREFILPLIIGKRFESPRDIHILLSQFKGNEFAKSVVDLAWWDLHAQSRHEPLWKTLGGRSPVVDVGADLSVKDSIDELLAEIGAAVQAGMKRVKLKCKPGWDLDMVAAVRAAFPQLVFHIDCNSAYTLEAAPLFRKLDQYGLAMIEQPLMHDDLIDHAALQKQIVTPICLDESITSPARARKAAAIGACRFVNLKMNRLGGLTPAIQVHDICREAGIGCWVGGMVATGVETGYATALATLPNCRYPSDIFPTARFYVQDVSDPVVDFCAPSQIAALDKPGIGYVPNPARLAAWTVDKFAVTR
ncbi:MAG: o-succinylbenzoate synthase [Verrucomicrobiae bacterium]|nr:o-succinylbenzoate synthase [Verrucomicrobiae bacterium]